ncbi:Serine/threonine-protein kinase STY8 [Linum grandiflorum]
MAAALECWSSSRAKTSNPAAADEDMVEQVLMRSDDRSESAAPDHDRDRDPASSSGMQKRFQKLSRNVSEAISSLKNSLNLDSVREIHYQQQGGGVGNGNGKGRVDQSCRKLVWASVVRNLTQLYPGSQLPEKLVSSIKKHYDSLPLSYAQAEFDMKEVFLHMKLMEQAVADEHPSMMLHEVSDDEVHGSVFKLTFACNSPISWPAMSGGLDSASMCCKKIQIFEKKGFTLGVVLLLVQAGQERMFKARIESALKYAVKKPKSTSVKLSFGLCGCQEENSNSRGRGRELGEIMEEDPCDVGYRNGMENVNGIIQLEMPLPSSSFMVSVDEWQTVQTGGDELGKWLLNHDNLEFTDQVGPTSFKGFYKGKKVGIEKLKGCEKGNSYEFEVRKDLLELMTCGHKNVLQFHGVCVDENHGLCVVTKLMDGGTVNELMFKSRNKLQTKEILRIAVDVAEGLGFLNDHGVAFRDLNTQRILLDRHGNACLGDVGIVAACKNAGEALEYETDGYRWLAPEIIAGDPESVCETWMSNVYSFGMVIWEMVTGEAAYGSCSPVQAAVGIAACGLRPEIPKDCPQILRSLMIKCWNNVPSKRPNFQEILSVLLQFYNNNSTCR